MLIPCFRKKMSRGCYKKFWCQTPVRCADTKITNLVSRILFLNYHLSAINITVYLLLPTLSLRRAAFKRLYTWHYSTQGLPMISITAYHCELLPHIFTFTPKQVRSSNFLWHYLLFRFSRTPGSSPVSCSVLSGLSFPTNRDDSSGL